MHEMFIQASVLLESLYKDGVNPFSRGAIMEPWITDFVDVPTIHEEATREIATLIRDVQREGKSKSRLLLGDTANGKSHVLARIKNTFTDRIFFCFVEPVIGDGQRMFRHILTNISRDLFRALPKVPFAQFERLWRDFFLGVSRRRKDRVQNLKAWTENRKLDLIQLIYQELKAEGVWIDPAFVGVLYEYGKRYRTDPRVSFTVETWLRGGPVSERELSALEFPFRSAIDTEDKAKELIKMLGVVSMFSRPIFLCFDQVEAYLYHDEACRAFVQAVEYLREYTYNYAIVVSAPFSFDEKLRSSMFPPSTWDRFNGKSHPIAIRPLTPEEGRQLVAARLAAEMGELEILRENPVFPFCTRDMDDILNPSGAQTRGSKPARYILADAETLFDAILKARPTPEDIEYSFSEDWPLHRDTDKPRPVFSWPQWEDIQTFIEEKHKEIVAHYRQHPPELPLSDEVYREIFLEIMLKALDVETAHNSFEISDVTVFHSGKPKGCDFALTLKRPSGESHTAGLLFCSDSRANIMKGIVKRAIELLQSSMVDTLWYVRDIRVPLTRAAKPIWKQLSALSDQPGPRIIPIAARVESLAGLRSLKRLVQFAEVGELSLYHARAKRQHVVSLQDVYRYLYQHDRLLKVPLIAEVLSGGSWEEKQKSKDFKAPANSPEIQGE